MILFALALLASAPAEAAAAPNPATAPAPAVATPAKAPDDLDTVVCHVDAETGTRLGTHKECHTKREWIQNQQEEARELGQSTTH